MNEALKLRAEELIVKLRLDDKRKLHRELETVSMKEGFWKETREATKTMKRIAELAKEIEEGEIVQLLLETEEESELAKEVNRLEFATYLSGSYDRGYAILALHAGQGGTEAMDWTSMLYRMYLRFCERKGWETNEVDYTPGDEAGIKSVTIEIFGSYAYGFLKAKAECTDWFVSLRLILIIYGKLHFPWWM